MILEASKLPYVRNTFLIKRIFQQYIFLSV